MRFGITFKIGVFATLLVIITAASIGLFMYWEAENIITRHELVDLSDETRLQGSKLAGVINTLREDVLYLAGLKEVDALVRARTRCESDPDTLELFDPVSGLTESALRAELQESFKKVCRVDLASESALFAGRASDFKPYLQVRFIGKPRLNSPAEVMQHPGGREIVRVYRSPVVLPDFYKRDVIPAQDAASEVVSAKPEVVFDHTKHFDLDDLDKSKFTKATEHYFTEPLRDSEGGRMNAQIYLSTVNLNREDGKIDQRIPVLRATVPVYDDFDKFFGIIVINLDFAGAARAIRNSPRSLEYVMDENRQFLVHPKPHYAFLWDQVETADTAAAANRARTRHDIARDEFYRSLGQAHHLAASPVAQPTSQPAGGIATRRIDFAQGHVEDGNDSYIAGDRRNGEQPVWLSEGFYLTTFTINKPTLKLGKREFANGFAKPFQQLIENYNYDASPEDHRDWWGRVRSNVDQKKGLAQISCLDKPALERLKTMLESDLRFNSKLNWKSTDSCRQLAVNYYRLPYHPGNSDRYFDLAIAASYEEFQSDVALVGRRILKGTLGLVLVAAVLAFLFSLILTRPLRQMTAAVVGFTNESSEIALPLKARDEIGVLANAFGEMFRQVRKRTAELRQSTQKLDQRVNRRTAQLRTKTEELQRKTEQLAAANGYKTDGLRGIAHELRAPLTGIDAAVRFLQSEIGGTLSAEKLQRVERISRSCAHVQTIVDNLGQIARYESGRLELHKSDVEVEQFIQDTVGMLEASFQKKKLEVRVDVDPVLDSIACDPGRTRQVLINLLSNAEKYTPAGGTLTVTAEQVYVGEQLRPERHLKISVTDTGAGIPAEDLPRVFNDFHRAENISQQAKGLGLGLALARRLVEMHAGTIGIESQLGVGTTAWFMLPCEATEPGPPPIDPEEDADQEEDTAQDQDTAQQST